MGATIWFISVTALTESRTQGLRAMIALSNLESEVKEEVVAVQTPEGPAPEAVTVAKMES